MDLNASTCRSFSSTLSEKSRAICGNFTRNLRSQLLEADYTMITLCSMQSVHADVYRQMGSDKNLWGTKLSVAIEDHSPAVHILVVKVRFLRGQSSFKERISHFHNLISRRFTSFLNAFECMWFNGASVCTDTRPNGTDSPSELVP